VTTSTPRRARNSLSRKKFLNRLNKGLPIFTAYGELNHIIRGDRCRHLQISKWIANHEIVTVTYRHTNCDFHTHVYLLDMNVERNGYNRNFVFRTQRSAEQYLAEGM